MESLQKYVSFLTSGSDEDVESDQSSICHSPSWEGYGQNKKKDKKKEAERKRKAKEQKEQAVHEAKTTKKRAPSRLSKAAPMPARQLWNVAERSNSAPVLNSDSFRASTSSQQLSTVDREQGYVRPGSHRASLLPSAAPVTTQMVDPARKRLNGGLKLQQEREAAPQYANQSQPMHNNGPDPRQTLRKSYSNGPVIDMRPPVSRGSSITNDSRSSKESCPPSASRTPMLRHTPAQQPAAKAPRGRDAKNYPVTSSCPSTGHSLESLEPDGSSNAKGGNDGYVRRHRDQSTERALAGLIDEQPMPTHSSSTRNTSRRPRRSSFIKDAKAAALRLTEHRGALAKGPDPVKRGSVDHGDYFNYPVPPGSPAADSAPSSSGGIQDTSTGKATPVVSNPTKESAGSGTPIQSGAAKGRSLKDVARAALGIPQSHGQGATSKPAAKLPPYHILRAKFSSSSSVPTVDTPIGSDTQIAELSRPAQSHSTAGPPAALNQPRSAVSEGSSSSSNYDDGSPLPSPLITPDSSRPQSSKGHPEEVGTPQKDQAEEATVQDDTITLRQLSGATISGSSSDVTTRLTLYDKEGDETPPKDRWSRTALPVDIDFEDAQSTVSDYSDAREEPVKTIPAPPSLEGGTGVADGPRFDERRDSFGQSLLSLSQCGPSPTGDSTTDSSPQAQEPAIPRRLEPREQQGPGYPKMGSAGQLFGNLSSKEPQTKDEPRKFEQRQKKLRKQKAAQHVPAERTADKDAMIGRSHDNSKVAAKEPPTDASLVSGRLTCPIGGFIPSHGFASNPLFVDFSEISKVASTNDQGTLPVKVAATRTICQRQSSEPKALTETPHATVSVAPTASRQQHETSAPEPAQAVTSSLAAVGPLARPKPAPASMSTTTPASILKCTAPQPQHQPGQSQGPARPSVPPAVPKHLQPPTAARSQPLAPPELRMAPIAKMFVECCSCRFYHDMPSKVYECMAKPDAVVEDRARGISGAITTMVKCPWCQHNMSTSCCAGYAAVVYIKEKLH